MNDDDLDFEAMMRRDGVVPLAGERASPRADRPAPAPAAARPAAPSEPAAPPRAVEPVAAVAALEGEVLTARARILALESELHTLGERLARAEARADAAEVRARSAEGQVRSLESKRDRQPAPAPTPDPLGVTAALAARGLEDAESQGRAVAALAVDRDGRSLLGRLSATDAGGLRAFLERRLALVCDAPSCRTLKAAVICDVPPARCEVCGGSDIQRAARAFEEACLAAGFRRVRVVGGSPSYHAQLEALFPRRGPSRSPIELILVRGDARVPLERAKAHQRRDDVVIIWGATELDHATSGAYRAAHGRVLVVPHRGIARMLEIAAAGLGDGGS